MRALLLALWLLATGCGGCADLKSNPTKDCTQNAPKRIWSVPSTIHVQAAPELVVDARSAAASWNAVPAGLTLVIDPGVGGVNQIAYQKDWKFNPNWVGVTLDSKIYLNETKFTSDYDPQSVLVHELGHFLGLGHSQDIGDTMYCIVFPFRHSLSKDDARALVELYR